MNNEQFEDIKKRLTETSSQYKDIVIKELKYIYPCIGCQYNDGLPHSACYNCDD